jgi:cell division protein FtsB
VAFWRGVKRRLKSLLAPGVFVAVASFFVWHTIHGERGTLARERRYEEIAAAQLGLEAARAENAAVQRRVNGLRAGFQCRFQNTLPLHITVSRRIAADVNRFITRLHMGSLRIGISVDSHRAHPQALGSGSDAAGNFAPVGNQDFAEHGQ